ncbi:MAG: hypothetical protein H8E76_03510 [Helicobacteraceae bacterium]|nr:hypothetical protein [Candidatus Sulfurimonas ponti]MBL6973443.1 hypothetical protein [Sulfurimonas sp.]
MESILDKVDFDKYSVYNIQVNVHESDVFPGGKENEVDEYGQSMDVVSDLRRTVKYSHPFDNKKIIKSILPEDEKEDSNGDLCRDINLEYYLLVDKEEMEDFSIEVLHDTLEEEWHSGSSGCDIIISPYEV